MSTEPNPANAEQNQFVEDWLLAWADAYIPPDDPPAVEDVMDLDAIDRVIELIQGTRGEPTGAEPDTTDTNRQETP